MGINRIKLANGMTNPNQGLADPKLTARQVAEQNPELHAMRQNFFGTDYLSDIDQGNTGTVQYYTGLGNPNDLQFTPPVVEETPAVDTIIPVVDGGDGDGGGGQATIPGAINTVVTPPNITPTNLNDFEGVGDTTMPSNLTSDMVGNIDTTSVDTYPSATSNVAPDGTTMANMTDDVDMNLIDQPFADTPVVLGSGNNALGLQDPQSLAIGPDGAVDFNTGPGMDGYVEGIDLDNATDFSRPNIGEISGDTQGTVLGGNPDINNMGDILDMNSIDQTDNISDYGMPQGSPGQLNPAATPSVDYSEFDDLEADVGAQPFQTVSEVEANDPNFRYRDQFMEDIKNLPGNIKNALTTSMDVGITDLGKVKNFFMNNGGQEIADNVFKIGDYTIDVAKTLTSGVISLIGSALTGIPGLGLLAGGLPPRDPRQTALDELYDVQDGTIQSGLMAGYNPVSGNPLDPNYGLQDAYQERIDSMENTLQEKYNMTDQEIADLYAGSYTGDVDTNLLDDVVELKDMKEKEKSRLDLFSGDVDERDQMLEDITQQNKNEIQLTDPNLKIEDRNRSDAPTGDVTTAIAPPSVLSKPTVAEIQEQERAARQAAANNAQRAANQELYRTSGGGGGGQPGSAPTGTAGRNPWGRAKGGLIRKPYSKGGIAGLKHAKR